jgi:hypothetical protein
LAGLFIVETLFTEPDLFNTYIAFDPSLWWNNRALVESAAERINVAAGRSVYLASSGEKELAELSRRLADVFQAHAPSTARWHYEAMPEESHATIYHPAALRAFRQLFKPEPGQR